MGFGVVQSRMVTELWVDSGWRPWASLCRAGLALPVMITSPESGSRPGDDPGGGMPQYRAVPVMLSAGERRALKKRARGVKTAHRDWLRAQIVLAAARGRASARIAADLHVSVDTVRKWRGRFAARGLDGLKDLPRSGRPRRISALERAAVVALACQLPAATGVPSARWSGPELAAEITKAGLARQISPSSVLAVSWPSTPSSRGSTSRGSSRATRILPPRPRSSSTFTRAITGASCARVTRFISVDAKPSIQARSDAARPARQHAAGRCASSTNTGARAPSPCWPPWTCAPGRCSPLPRPPPGSPHSWT